MCLTPCTRWVDPVFGLRSFRDGVLLAAQWLEEAGFLSCSSAGWDNAAGGGHLHVLEVMFFSTVARASFACPAVVRAELFCFVAA